MSSNAPIGIFDSGLGGISVLKEMKKQLPNEHFIYFGDSHYAPYGTKNKDEIISRCIAICDYFMSQKVKAIVIACNTATSAAATILRAKYPIPIIGMEPALKPAAYQKKNQNIIVMATPLTLKEKKFKDLMSHFSNDNHIIKMPCPELVEIVENNELDQNEKVMHQLDLYYKNIDTSAIDSIVLGCTHFVFYRPYFNSYFQHINIIDGNAGTVHHLANVLKERDLLCVDEVGSIRIENSSKDPRFSILSEQLLDKEI